MTAITIQSSGGDIDIHPETGEVLGVRLHDSNDPDYTHFLEIKQFDLSSYRCLERLLMLSGVWRITPKQEVEHIDILHIGYWYTPAGETTPRYVPPDWDNINLIADLHLENYPITKEQPV